MSITRIGIVSIPVSDQERAKAFYADTLGFEVVRDTPMSERARWIELRPPGAETAIVLVTWFDAMPPGSAHHLLECDDIDAERERLAAAGADVGAVQDAPWGRYALLKDLDGNVWVVQTTAHAYRR
jgi:catechol 2,3-dioxygenase-like lactoylglutathione lyase family enzyme